VRNGNYFGNLEERKQLLNTARKGNALHLLKNVYSKSVQLVISMAV
jgi:hypothetical protein